MEKISYVVTIIQKSQITVSAHSAKEARKLARDILDNRENTREIELNSSGWEIDETVDARWY